MEDFLKKLKRVLREKFSPPDRIKLVKQDRIVGLVVSQQFEGLTSMDRMNMIWDHLDERLTKDERKNVVIILAATPAEELAQTA